MLVDFIIFGQNLVKHLSTMKRLLIFLISVIVFCGCDKPAIHFIGSPPVLDGCEQTVILNTDVKITSFRVKTHTSSGSAIISNKFSEDGKTLTCEDTWFKAVVDNVTGKRIVLTVKENDRDSDRQLAITVQHLCFESATMEIVQPAQSL